MPVPMVFNPDRFTASPSPVSAGSTLTICFSNPALANTTVTIQLTNGEGASDSIEITLDAEGHGCKGWTVPQWDLVTMSQSTSADHTVAVT